MYSESYILHKICTFYYLCSSDVCKNLESYEPINALGMKLVICFVLSNEPAPQSLNLKPLHYINTDKQRATAVLLNLYWIML